MYKYECIWQTFSATYYTWLHIRSLELSLKTFATNAHELLPNQRTITYLYRVILGRDNVKQIFVDEQSWMEIFNGSRVLKSGRCIMKIEKLAKWYLKYDDVL